MCRSRRSTILISKTTSSYSITWHLVQIEASKKARYVSSITLEPCPTLSSRTSKCHSYFAMMVFSKKSLQKYSKICILEDNQLIFNNFATKYQVSQLTLHPFLYHLNQLTIISRSRL